MEIKILKDYSEIKPFIPTVRDAADRHRDSFGFLPANAYDEQAAAGKLWIAVTSDKSYAGHILFGGQYPTLRVFQLFTVQKFRRYGIARELLRALVNHGERLGYIMISAHVAADLVANKFWEKEGFVIYHQREGGKSRKRRINIRARELDTLSLFKHERAVLHSALQDIRYTDGPISRAPTYILDVNVVFDAIRHRAATKYAQALIGAGLNNQVRLCISSEFIEELKRKAANDTDPLLSFVSNLPTLPPADESQVNDLVQQLRPAVFPSRNRGQASPLNDTSDLRHLANAIIHRTRGLVTSEKAILAASDFLKDTYGIEVISPADLFAQEFVEPNPIQYLGSDLTIRESTESERLAVERFLLNQNVPRHILGEVWDSGTASCRRRRLCVWKDETIVAASSWTVPTKCNSSVIFYLYIDENDPFAELIAGHFIELTQLDLPMGEWARWVLVTPTFNTKTKAVALDRGFRAGLGYGGAPDGALSKVGFRGVITAETWGLFIEGFRSLTGISLNSRMPTFEEFTHTGVEAISADKQALFISLLKLETLISPAIILCSGRSGIILPIQSKFAGDLLYGLKSQQDLFGSSNALLHVEKAYFRSTLKSGAFQAGMLVIFYVSGSGGGRKEAIGAARITFSKVLPPEEAILSLSTQGVLPKQELEAMVNKQGMIHAFTFDNFNYFEVPLPFGWLRENGLVSGANLVTAESLSPKQLAAILSAGYSKSK